MKKRLLLLNLALLAVLLLLGRQLRLKYQQANRRETAMLSRSVPAAQVPGVAPLRKGAPVDATAYQDTVAKNLFSRDRSPTPIPDPPAPPPPPPPQPAFPVVRGVMLWNGVPPTVVMSAQKGSNDQRGYHPGEKVGEWKILSVDNKYIGLEWSGKQFQKRIDELMDRTPITVAEAAPPPATAAAPAPASKSLSESKNGQGADMGANYRGCTADDKSPAGTVADGRKKIVSATPFGTVCRWEPVQ
ncbi:MAG: hypothetical protein ACR2NN_18770 [Bryobacteraceae bacterium]